MKAPFPKSVRVSVRVYTWLLALYPKDYREEYGADMAQLFRDQCNDSWKEARHMGLFLLWLRIIPDLLKSSMVERLEYSKGRTTMPPNSSSASARKAFLITAIISFAVIYPTIVATTFWLLPEKYASIARIELLQSNSPKGDLTRADLQTQFKTILSPAVLDPVISTLDLKKTIGRELEYALNLEETRSVLQSRIRIIPTRSTSLIEIWSYGSDRSQNASIANKIAETYAQLPHSNSETIRIVDYAKPGIYPVSPNKPLNLIIGAIFCIALAGLVSAAIRVIARIRGKKHALS